MCVPLSRVLMVQLHMIYISVMSRLLAITRGLHASNITTIQIMKNKISTVGIDTLCIEFDAPRLGLSRGRAGLMANNLRNVQLDCNPIGAQGATNLAHALGSSKTLWCRLTSLRVGYAQLASSGLSLSLFLSSPRLYISTESLFLSLYLFLFAMTTSRGKNDSHLD